MSLDASSLFAQDGFAQSDAGPLYVRLQDRIKRAIKNGSLKPLAALPGERDIAQSLNVSRVTVRKALSGLVSAGLLEQRQGATRLAPVPIEHGETAQTDGVEGVFLPQQFLVQQRRLLQQWARLTLELAHGFEHVEAMALIIDR